MNETTLALVSGSAMMAVGLGAVYVWRRMTGLPRKWLWIGVALWAVAVLVKLGVGLSLNQKVLGYFASMHSKPLLLSLGGLFIGLESSLCEVGLTFAAVWKWRQLGKDAPSAIGIGVGAGAIEALLLGTAVLAAAAISLSGMGDEETLGGKATSPLNTTFLVWLLMPLERVIALLGHTGSRALVLLGVAHRRPAMVFWGWLMFTLVDGIAGAFLLLGKKNAISGWWLELVLLPLALVCIPILRWCWRKWPAASPPL